ncbi:hypothetical protein PaecuDRAFT_1875 [Paenibacillus curdlanolyticus YK9]|uniref:Uncharacterized protein n=1 Tax=Paenibacillus curdlanolyticus YK9 TaxID=717606 RepID=E0I8C4_9BACL|nr:hypothetical protein [Paenibacillus curdlanolyticus]EFM11429.1 hypothetical protein PaecuDRAFT_1875 [Paenibacillus curdlanolyticus YK9]
MQNEKKKSFSQDELSQIHNISEIVSEFLGIEDFVIYGGYISDVIEKGNAYGSDIDIAIKYENEKQITDILKRLAERNFKIVAERDYYIKYDEYVKLYYLENESYFLDIAFMQDPQDIGIFTIDSIIYLNKERIIIDKYDGIKDLKERNLRLSNPDICENPLYILSRLMCVTSKYGIPLRDKKIESIIVNLGQGRNELNIGKKNDIQASFLARLFKSIICSVDRVEYIGALIHYNIIGRGPQVLEVLFTRIISNNSNELMKVSTSKELIKLLHSYAQDEEVKDLVECISLFKYRYWSNEEFELAQTLDV